MNELKKGCVAYYVHNEINFERIEKTIVRKIGPNSVLTDDGYIDIKFIFKTKKEANEKLISLLKDHIYICQLNIDSAISRGKREIDRLENIIVLCVRRKK